MSFRKENKYRLSLSEQKLLKASLLTTGMRPQYPRRKINSCYFDTLDLALFTASEEGILPRKKVRIRWYNQDTKTTKEEKISSIEGRFKIVSDFEQQNFLCNFQAKFFDQTYGILKPVMLVSYQREYYLLKGLRITFDSEIHYRDLRTKNDRTYIDHESVMEIKSTIETTDDYVQTIIKHPTSRFSKYARGLLMANQWL
ncbi:MAG: hypothetical protein CMO31_04745 [Trueperaceae bacterium]|jgi:hypothetical protein|nr:hypothetical protein [Trueperaceae bacterium]|tara:strand:+ start:6156 stop:6752 length:597 start_codon:yes stop_codon:yes gene_type:complete